MASLLVPLVVGLPVEGAPLDGVTGASYAKPPSVPRGEEEIRQVIEQWLADHWLMSLATVHPDGSPHISGVVYAVDGATVYFVARKDTNKIRNIHEQPRVAYTVWDPVDDMQQLKALQIIGATRELEGAERERALKRFENPPADEGHAVVEIRPLVARWTDRSRGADYTDVLYFQEDE
jgi:uncharacterized protein YhbP (UPF0306 family)